jgi:hypothetical protein
VQKRVQLFQIIIKRASHHGRQIAQNILMAGAAPGFLLSQVPVTLKRGNKTANRFLDIYQPLYRYYCHGDVQRKK